MSRFIPEPVRRFVVARAQNRCEYCRVHQNDSFLPLEIDHIVGIKHGGSNEPERVIHRQLLQEDGLWP